MKKLSTHKFTVIILTAILLIINVADAFGYVWCLGDDGHVDVKQIKYDGCCDTEQKHPEKRITDTKGSSFSKGEACGPCIDLFVKQGKATVLKRDKRVSSPSLDLAIQYGSHAFTPPCECAEQHRPELQTHVSQAIRFHRTIVLLN